MLEALKTGFWADKRLVNPSVGEKLTKTTDYCRFNAMNNKSNGKSRVKTKYLLPLFQLQVLLSVSLAMSAFGQGAFQDP